MSALSATSAQAERLAAMLAATERQGAKVLFVVRTLAVMAVYAFFVAANAWSMRLMYQLSFSLVFLAIGFAAYYFSVVKPGHRWLVYLLGFLDLVVVMYLVLSDNPFDPHPPFPKPLHLREGQFQYLLIFVALPALTLAPRLVLFMGAAASALWIAAVAWVLQQPGTTSDLAAPPNLLTRADEIAYFLGPNFVSVSNQVEHTVMICIVAGILSAAVWRSRRFVLDYADAERARSNLARHFSPNMIDEIANQDQPFGPVRKQKIGVLFADIVGFTRFSEEQPPDVVFELLRQFHRRMEQIVFDHKGTLDNYIGDCVMATFGVPNTTRDDARHAIACGIAMIDELVRWNAERARHGLVAVDARVGVHYGAVVLGAIGSERMLSFAAIGDTCNVASRLQALCRDEDASLCVGHDCLEAVDRDYAKAAESFGLVDGGSHDLRGRGQPVRVWRLPR